MNRWIVAAVIFAVVGIGVAFVSWTDHDDWGPNRGADIVARSVAEDGSEVIVIREDDRHFFPFGLFIFPLVIFLTVFALRGFAFRGHSAGFGQWRQGGPGAGRTPDWFDEWHRRAHAGATAPHTATDRDPEPTA